MDMITSYRSETENYIQHYDVTWKCLRWPKPIYLHDGYVFDLCFSAGNI